MNEESMRDLSGRWIGAFLVVLFTLGLGAEAARGGSLEGIAGWEGDTFSQGYGFLAMGGSFPLKGAWTLPVRVQGSYLYYNFEEQGGTTKVTSPGAGAALGMRVSGAKGSATVWAGPEFRREQRDVEGSGGSVTETQTGAIVQAEADWVMGRSWHSFILGNYASAARYLWGRAALRYQLTNREWTGPVSAFVGLEGNRQGNNESNAWEGGAYVEATMVPSRISLSLHGGYKEDWSPGQHHDGGAYIGFGLYRKF